MTEDRATNATPSELVSAVAHELQAPIAAVRASSAALRGREDLDTETRDRLLAVISNAAEQLGRLAEDLLLAGLLGEGAFRLDVRSCDAGEVVVKAVEAVRAAAPGESEVLLALAGRLSPVLVDPTRLEQVIANLVGNALKHSRSGEPVSVGLEEAGGTVQIAVSDQGPGIPAREQARIFERFQRGTTGAPGSGLGLYIARELMTAMGGDIQVESGNQEGTTFVVRVPVA